MKSSLIIDDNGSRWWYFCAALRRQGGAEIEWGYGSKTSVCAGARIDYEDTHNIMDVDYTGTRRWYNRKGWFGRPGGYAVEGNNGGKRGNDIYINVGIVHE